MVANGPYRFTRKKFGAVYLNLSPTSAVGYSAPLASFARQSYVNNR